MGSSDVAGIGMGSKIHQTTTHTVTPSVIAGSMSPPLCHSVKNAQNAIKGPKYKASVRGLGYGFNMAGEGSGHG